MSIRQVVFAHLTDNTSCDSSGIARKKLGLSKFVFDHVDRAFECGGLSLLSFVANPQADAGDSSRKMAVNPCTPNLVVMRDSGAGLQNTVAI